MTFLITADLSSSQGKERVWDLKGVTDYEVNSKSTHVPTTGVYYEGKDGKIELLAFGHLGGASRKLNIAVQPDHPVLIRRGTSAVVMTGNQTVQNGAPAQVVCHVLREP